MTDSGIPETRRSTGERLAPPSSSGLTAENLFHDPYPVYARLRREAPVQFFEGTGEWLVTRWEDCRKVGSEDSLFGPDGSAQRPEARVMGYPNVLSMSGSEHACLRQGIDAKVKPDVVPGYIGELAHPVVRRYIDAIRHRGSADLTTELFELISVRIIATVLGLEGVDDATLAKWFHALNGGIQNIRNDPGIWAACDAAREEIDAALRPTVERVTARPDDSMISHIVHGGMPDGRTRSFEDIMPSMRVILLGGLQEPGHGAANAMLGLLEHPDQGKQVASDPDRLAQRAYDEGLRWIAPIGVTPRMAQRDFELAGVTIPQGASVAIVLASANRDESFFNEPDSFVLDRTRKQNSSFGYRPHFCSGHFISRAIGRIALAETLKALPNLRLDPDRQAVTRGWRFRGVTHLPVVWDA